MREAKGVYRAHRCSEGRATRSTPAVRRRHGGQTWRAEARAALLATERQAASPSVLSLDDEKGLPVELDVTKLGKVTVLVFFSTWCPHCGLELPRVVSVRQGRGPAPELKDKVTCSASAPPSSASTSHRRRSPKRMGITSGS